MTAPTKPGPFAFGRVFAKASGLWLGGLGTVSAVAEFSDLVDAAKEQFSQTDGAIGYAYAAVLLGTYAVEGVRYKLRLDLYQSRLENRAARRKRRVR